MSFQGLYAPSNIVAKLDNSIEAFEKCKIAVAQLELEVLRHDEGIEKQLAKVCLAIAENALKRAENEFSSYIFNLRKKGYRYY
jgi:hypothetical protein